MNQPIPDKPTELAIDTEQWRREIKTFTTATNRALDAIAAELSRECSAIASPGCSQGSTQNSHENGEPTPKTPPKFEASETNGRQRLADLKSQLAKRISTSD